MSHYLVTGGAGFIGSHIAETLIKNNQQVTIVDNLSTGKRKTIESFASDVNFVEGDVADKNVLTKAFKNVDVVFHHAAFVSVPLSIEDPSGNHNANVNGTFQVLLAAKELGVKRVILASSSAVYGDTEVLPVKETTPLNPISPYGLSKSIGEQYCQQFSHVYGLETVCLRYFNVFGPRQSVDSAYAAAIPKFVSKVLNNEEPVIFGDGEQTRDFNYVANVVEANLAAAEAQNVSGKILNIASGHTISINQLMQMLREITGQNISPEYTDPRPGDILHSAADISLAKECLGYKGSEIRPGVEKTVEWFKQQTSV